MDRADGVSGEAIAAHRSIHIKEISVENTLRVNLVSQPIDFVQIEAFINSEHFLKLWSLYIPPSSNPFAALLNNLFQFIGQNSILGGDVNGYDPTWNIINSLNHRGDIVFFSFNNFNLCCLSSGALTYS